MKIIVDAFGGDNAPLEVIKGARLAADEYGCEVILSGDEHKIKAVAGQENISLSGLTISHADGFIPMEAEPTDVLKKYKGCSMEHAMQLLAQGQGEAVVSAGSTGALLVSGTMIAKRIKGVKRACLATILPTSKSNMLLLDCGANVECRPETLCQFGVMGSVYVKNLLGVDNPRVGLVNVGTEDTKGGELQLEAFGLLKTAPINFIGNIEARDIPAGGCDVAVADGFTGNIILKLMEGMAKFFSAEFKSIMLKNTATKLGALSMKKGVMAMKKKLDASEHGGAPLLGLRKPVIKSHGNADAMAIKNAIRQAIACVGNDISGQIEQSMSQFFADKTSQE